MKTTPTARFIHSIRWLSLLGLCLCPFHGIRANIIDFETILVGPPIGSVFGATAVFDDSAKTLEILLTGLYGVSSGTINAPTTIPLAGIAGIATEEFVSLHHPPSGPISSQATLDLTLTSTYDSAFLASNGGTATGAEAALVNALLAEKAYIDISTEAGHWQAFLVQVSDTANTSSLLSFALAGMAGFGSLQKRLNKRPSL